MAKKPERQGIPKRVMVSPINGAECRTIQPGEVRNPKGSSLKSRARSALKKILTEEALANGMRNVSEMSSDPEQGMVAVAALKLMLERSLGPVGPQSAGTVTIRTELVMMPPTGGERDDADSAPRMSTVATINMPHAIQSDEADYD